MNHDDMLKALKALDKYFNKDVTLIVGGGGAMVLAHGFPLATHDLDAYPKGITLEELDGPVKQVAKTLSLPGDWLNPYFSTFAHTLPDDYESRLIEVYKGASLHVRALGAEDLLIMKCFAHRPKDIAHARALLKKNPDIKFIEMHFDRLQKKKIPGIEQAVDFFDDLMDQV